jgi:lipopolysaccharide export system permease protein
LLAFGRLSSDSEITAIRAAGASIPRIVRPVFLFSIVIALITFYINDQLAPPAERQSVALVLSIDNHTAKKAGDPVFFPIDGALVVAQAFDGLHSTMSGVTIVASDKKGNPSFYMQCKELEYHRETKEWHVRGGAEIVPADGGVKSIVTEAFPKSVADIKLSPEDISTINNHDMDVYSMADAVRQIEHGKREGTLSLKDIRNLEFSYWNKISVALAAIVFGTLGAVLGIRGQRTSAASGFALAIGIIFGYFMITNFMNVWALDGVLPAWGASFAPIVIGMASAGVIMWRRNS